MKSSKAAALLVCCLLTCSADAAEMAVSIRADFPGGNVSVLQNAGATVQVAPDLRGGQPWFYWHFEATATQPGRDVSIPRTSAHRRARTGGES